MGICLHMHVHFRGALTDEEEAPDAMTDADTVVLQNVAVALGFDALMVLDAQAGWRASEQLMPSLFRFGPRILTCKPPRMCSSVCRFARRADDKNVIEFEKKVLDTVLGRTLATTSTTSLLSG